MNEEKVKNILLILLVVFIIGGTIWAAFSLNYSPIKDLRDNSTIETKSYKEVSEQNNNNNNNNNDENILSNIDATKDQTVEGSDTSRISSINSNTFTEEELSNFSTTIYDKEEARIHNIKLAVSKLDGAVIKSGEEFSFNNTVGPMSAKQGYKKATGFNGNGRKIKIYGGGMCQISSTLYNAALIANFKITERHPHSRRVYYVAKDKDATVSYGGADLKFINTNQNSVKISAATDGHEVNIKLSTTK